MGYENLEIDDDAPDAEQIRRIFASIKGTR